MPHAVVVPDTLQNTHNILPAAFLSSKSEYPFGLSIITHTPTTELPLFYVSPKAAIDRAPGKHPTNGGGVIPGWYAIAQPGMFQIQVTRLHQSFPPGLILPQEDVFSLALSVDGKDTHQRRVFHAGTPSSTVFTGFVEQRIPSPSVLLQRTTILRPFAFEKVYGVESDTDTGGDDIGAIRMRVRSGALEFDAGINEVIKSYQYNDDTIAEKTVAKEGRSIQASQNVSAVAYNSRLSPYTVGKKREIPEAGITIFVRERSWLHSRRIIDDHDQPVFYEQFCEMIAADEKNLKRKSVVDGDQLPTGKRPRIKEQMVLTEDVQPVKPGEVIDLT